MTPPIKLPADNRLLVFRGGGWYSTGPSVFRSAGRFGRGPAGRGDGLGFRCAQRGCCQPLKVTP